MVIVGSRPRGIVLEYRMEEDSGLSFNNVEASKRLDTSDVEIEKRLTKIGS